MNFKTLTIKQQLLIVIPFVFMIVAILIGSKSYFNHQEIKLASSGCEVQGGNPVVETTFLTLGYSFSCEGKDF